MKLTKKNLERIHPDKRIKAVIKEYIKCKNDPKYCIQTYFTVKSKSKRIPFKLFPHQIEMIDSYEEFNQNLSMKTRQMGFTTGTCAYMGWFMSTKNNKVLKVVSKTMNDSQKVLKEVRDLLDDARKNFPWLIPEIDKSNNNKRSFTLMTGSIITAESTTEDAARGDTLDLFFCDEVAAIDRRNPEKMAEIWSAAGVALTNSRGKAILVSTPKGMSGFYYNQYVNAKEIGWNIIDAHWTRHPEYSLGTYQWITDEKNEKGGYLKWYNENWPETIKDLKTNTFRKIDKETYEFILDGKIRSPWYDNESRALGPQRSRCELDCSFAGTGGEVLDTDLLREIKIYADSSKFSNPYEKLGGIYRKYKKYKDYDPTHKYILAADVATGDGSDFSAFVVLDLISLEICATYKEQLLPEVFALIIKQIANDYGKCQCIIENAGGGGTTLQELKRQGYANLYYSVLQKKDPSTGMKKRKIGLWISEDVRWQGGDKLEGMLRLKKIKVPCLDICEEFYTWIWDKDGKRRHAPEKNDDLILALQHACWYYFYVFLRGERNRNNFTNIFEVQRNNQKIHLSDSAYAKGSVVKRINEYTPIVSRNYSTYSQTSISGNIDRMIDEKVLSRDEIEMIESDNNSNRSIGRRPFL